MTVWAYPRVFMADIIAEVGHVFGVSPEALKGASRVRGVVRPRFVCSYLGHRLTYLSYPMLGRALGDRDHSTIIHGVNQAKLYMGRDPEFRAYVDAVRIRLLTTRQRSEQRRLEALAIRRARARQDRAEAERIELAEAETTRVPNDMDDLSNAVAAYVANGGSFIEVYA